MVKGVTTVCHFYYRGEKFAFGHMYVKPHETFHEPNRKFFPNEVTYLLSSSIFCCMHASYVN